MVRLEAVGKATLYKAAIWYHATLSIKLTSKFFKAPAFIFGKQAVTITLAPSLFFLRILLIVLTVLASVEEKTPQPYTTIMSAFLTEDCLSPFAIK